MVIDGMTLFIVILYTLTTALVGVAFGHRWANNYKTQGCLYIDEEGLAYAEFDAEEVLDSDVIVLDVIHLGEEDQNE